MNALLWHNLWKLPIAKAVEEAAARHLERLGTPATHVILPLGEWPPVVSGLRVQTCLTVKGPFLKVYADGS